VGGKPVFCPFLDGWLLWLSLPQNYQWTSTGIKGTAFQKAVSFIVTAVRTPDPT
jgi:hypothetical protein